jgi:hypothetical protein
MKAFPKLQEFVDATNLFLKYGITGKTIFASDVRNDILEGLDGTNDQSYFDGIKQLLNTLDYSNLQIELIGKEYPKGHRKGAEFEKSRSLTSFYDNSIAVRNEIYNIMKLGGLKNNYPKNGFLCPFELEDMHEEDEARKQDKPEQEDTKRDNGEKTIEKVGASLIFADRKTIESGLKNYLKGDFVMSEEGRNYNHLLDTIINFSDGSGIDFATIAYIIFQSKYFQNPPKGGFKGWHKRFCGIVNGIYKKYDKNDAVKHFNEKKYDKIKINLSW